MKPTYLLLAALVLSGCSQERLMEKKRLKAEALVKEAIETYPGIIDPVITTDTITLISPPVVIKERVGYSQASMDSLATICAELLKAEREYRPTVVRRIVNQACNIDTATFSKGSVDVMVWAQNGMLDVLVMKHAEQLDTVTTKSTRVINSTPCPPVETCRIKSQFWVGFIVGVVFIVGCLMFLNFMRGSNKFE